MHLEDDFDLDDDSDEPLDEEAGPAIATYATGRKDEPGEATLLYSAEKPPAVRCETCEGRGVHRKHYYTFTVCRECHGAGYFGITPNVATQFSPGSAGKVAVLAERYRAGIDLWVHGDQSEIGNQNIPMNFRRFGWI